jgi:hypothetical protein
MPREPPPPKPPPPPGPLLPRKPNPAAPLLPSPLHQVDGVGTGALEAAARYTSVDVDSLVTWPKGAPVPYSCLTSTFEAIAGTTKRLEIIEALTGCFRAILASHPADLLPAVYLCSNRVGPPHEGLELGVGESILIKVGVGGGGRGGAGVDGGASGPGHLSGPLNPGATPAPTELHCSAAPRTRQALAETTGRKEALIKKDYEDKGDLGAVAAASRSAQRLLSKPAPLTLAGVFKRFREIATASGAKSQERKRALIGKLLVSSTGEEPGWVGAAASGAGGGGGGQGFWGAAAAGAGRSAGGRRSSRCRERRRHTPADPASLPPHPLSIHSPSYIIRSLQGKLRIGLAEQSLLAALAHAVSLHQDGAKGGKLVLAERLAEAEATVKQVSGARRTQGLGPAPGGADAGQTGGAVRAATAPVFHRCSTVLVAPNLKTPHASPTPFPPPHPHPRSTASAPPLTSSCPRCWTTPSRSCRPT